MFKNLFEFLGAEYDAPQSDFEKTFFGKIGKFAFYDDLNAACLKTTGKDIPALIAAGNYKAVVAALLESAGLNYGALPKGLLKFHKYEDGSRTPLEEHLAEGAMYAAGKSGKVNVHFTVSTEHRELFKKLVEEKTGEFAKRYGVDYYITFSEQKPSTDTVAADMENKPFRDNGKLLFRPGGHGALIENLNDLDADVIFIKNIDNVVPDKLKGDTVLYKKLIAGVLITLQQQAFAYLQLLDSGKYTHEQVLDILQFVQKKLFCKNPETKNLEDAELVIYLKEKLNRPMRVCGMVKNVGEPGGGPFLAYNSDGTISLQILESSQIDMNDPEKKDIGISALCEYSLLSDNVYPTYAVTKKELKDSGVKAEKQVSELEEIGCIVLELGYFIDFLGKGFQDPLSVVLSLTGDEQEEERVDISINEMLEEYVWSKD